MILPLGQTQLADRILHRIHNPTRRVRQCPIPVENDEIEATTHDAPSSSAMKVSGTEALTSNSLPTSR